jgi:nucleoside-diphosphate-sugar epimerase
LYRPGAGFRGAEGNLLEFVDKNVMGSLRLMETSIRKEVGRFVFISTCAVHEIILDDRPLDEAHPLWATNHYGAHKAAIEKFVHSYGFGKDYPICSLRPTGIYGLARRANTSKWFDIVQAVKQGKPIESKKGGKEVHAADVAKAVEILLQAQGIAGQAYNCYDRYISDVQVARVAKEITGSDSSISDLNKGPKNQISTEKIRRLGMEFGGETLLRKTVKQMLEAG